MAENLNYRTSEGSFCYDKNETNCTKYGRLYKWETAMKGASSTNKTISRVQGICPNGWHLPSDKEWQTMEMYLGMDKEDANDLGSYTRGYDEGAKIKQKGDDRWSRFQSRTNQSGFSALPAGENYYSNSSGMGDFANFWTSTRIEHKGIFWRRLCYLDNYIYRGTQNTLYSYSVRCVKD